MVMVSPVPNATLFVGADLAGKIPKVHTKLDT